MSENLWEGIKFFKPEEFDDPTEKGSGSKMNIEFVKLLDLIRGDCDFPFEINSGYRTPEHNEQVGGKFDSAHTKGVAADISCNDSVERFAILKAAFNRGVKRIGIGSNFVHLDMSFDLPQGVSWLYPEGATATNQKAQTKPV